MFLEILKYFSDILQKYLFQGMGVACSVVMSYPV